MTTNFSTEDSTLIDVEGDEFLVIFISKLGEILDRFGMSHQVPEP